jgi:GntR family transcriptional regulator
MLYRIEPDRKKSSNPVYEQIKSQVIFRVASGALGPGERIPSVRDLAEMLTVHPNTVARAVQDLERDGVVIARRGKWMEVAADAPRLCKDLRQKIVRERLGEVLREVATSGMSADEIRRLVDEELASVNGKA